MKKINLNTIIAKVFYKKGQFSPLRFIIVVPMTLIVAWVIVGVTYNLTYEAITGHESAEMVEYHKDQANEKAKEAKQAAEDKKIADAEAKEEAKAAKEIEDKAKADAEADKAEEANDDKLQDFLLDVRQVVRTGGALSADTPLEQPYVELEQKGYGLPDEVREQPLVKKLLGYISDNATSYDYDKTESKIWYLVETLQDEN